MSWVADYEYTWAERISMRALRTCGHIPKHVAFVMDGNRRFARSQQIDKIEGHSRGFSKLADCLRWCLDLGINEVTTFAFSIENFKRSSEEVEGLFNLARDKFAKLLKETDRLNQHGIRIRVIGNIGLLPLDLQELVATAMLSTEVNDKLFLNVAFSYTSRDEITQALETVLQQGNSFISGSNISERLLEECMYTRHSPAPDLIFRTSGETRLSDFMMWQLSGSVLYFSNVLWPQITFWNFLASILAYQRDRYRLEKFRRAEQIQSAQLARTSDFHSERVQQFLQSMDEDRRKLLVRLASSKMC
ncbi:GL15247 [Drosophila persimilis]|uniref:Alkyl transferase n=2 Tax=pseudoobscura subgroup TaxID=32358 RepID=Q29J99_DROPS|nr:dehydrodolichyl diphosphate synthase complex subunit DHDDS [Drosophila pseudoobscura]XP_002025533.1 dehydrodolichyl diphosphate synthase complex subunit DHDDS [Drosophila persimilis]EDW31055.1 GL15247 [Drosophila persimilis]